MNKTVAVIGVAAFATLAGCKDPDYKYAKDIPEAKIADPGQAQRQAPVLNAPVREYPSCNCPPGAKHEVPCACGAPNCKCEVVKPRPLPPPPPPEPEYTVYVVRNGDYLAKISKRYNVTISSIKRLNGLKNDTIRPGQKLKLPGRIDVEAAPAAPVAAPAHKAKTTAQAYTGETKEYIVKAGDTLGAIAYGNGCSIRQLKSLNGLTNDTVRVGQKLKVPAKGAPAAKQPKTAKKPAPAPEKNDAKPAADTAVPGASDADKAIDDLAKIESSGSEAKPAVVQAPAVPAEPEYTTHEVQEGEDMTAICIRFSVSSAAVEALNNLEPGAQLRPGQVIKIPSEATR